MSETAHTAFRAGWESFEQKDGKSNPYDGITERDEFSAFARGYTEARVFHLNKPSSA